MQIQLVGNVLLGLGLLVGAYTDLRWRRLPNWLTLGMAAFGLGLSSLTGGPAGILDSLIGWLLGCALLFVPFALKGIGAGDVKLLAAVGALKGPSFLLEAALYMAFVGGLQALVLLILRGSLVPLLRGVLYDIWFALRTVIVHHTLPKPSALTFQATLFEAGAAGHQATDRHTLAVPYGVAIAAGGLLTLLLKG